jgi:hypothetical protein
MKDRPPDLTIFPEDFLRIIPMMSVPVQHQQLQTTTAGDNVRASQTG